MVLKYKIHRTVSGTNATTSLLSAPWQNWRCEPPTTPDCSLNWTFMGIKDLLTRCLALQSALLTNNWRHTNSQSMNLRAHVQCQIERSPCQDSLKLVTSIRPVYLPKLAALSTRHFPTTSSSTRRACTKAPPRKFWLLTWLLESGGVSKPTVTHILA